MNAVNYVYTESLEKQYAIYCPFKGKPYCLCHLILLQFHIMMNEKMRLPLPPICKGKTASPFSSPQF